MLLVMIRKEILESLLSSRFTISSLLCLSLIPLGFYANLKGYEQALSDYLQSVQIYESSMKGNPNINFQGEGYRSPSAFIIFSTGFENILPTKIITSRDKGVEILNTRGTDNSLSLLFGKVDLAFVVTSIISLLALVLIFDSISGEKENGTLKVILSNPVSRSSILLSKLIGNCFVLMIPFMVAISIGFLILSVSGTISPWQSDFFTRFILIIATTLLFIFCFFLVGILVSTLTSRSITALIGVLFLWVILAIIFPRASTMMAEVIYPVKSQQVVETEKAFQKESIEKEKDKRLRLLYDRAAIEFNENPNSISVGPEQTPLQKTYNQRKVPIETEYNEKVQRELNRIENDFLREKKIQDAIARNIARLSPVSCYTFIVSELACTGSLQALQFLQDVQRFYEKIQEEVYSHFRIETYGSSGGATASRINTDPDIPKKENMSRFQTHFVPISIVWDKVWVDFLLLCLYCLAFFAIAYFSFLLYDAR